MDDKLEERIEALERTVADGEFDHQPGDHAERVERLAAVESQLESIEARIEDLEAATQALRGYVGNIRAVNDDVEQRANAALAKAEALESTLDGAERSETDKPPGAAGSTDSARVATAGAEKKETDRCQSCGRAHDRASETDPKSAPGTTDGGHSHAAGTDPGQATDDPLVPDESSETGTLQRIREML